MYAQIQRKRKSLQLLKKKKQNVRMIDVCKCDWVITIGMIMYQRQSNNHVIK